MRTNVLLALTLCAMSAHGAHVDVGVDTLLVDTAYDGWFWFSPAARLHNYGDTATAFTAWARLWRDDSGLVYTESIRVPALAPATDTTLTFPTRLLMTDSWTLACSTYAPLDSVAANDTRQARFRVYLGPGG